ncbi:hypothetical protein MHK_010325 [Candidatus Magnetomorum sp. HK-1]|nr:hypothetical protein MHK_010325 [Candidatus Magnetomorum sp. HK-1]
MDNAKNAEEVWKLFAEVSKQFKETDLKFKETDLKFKETDRLIKDYREQKKMDDKATNKKIRELGAQIGGLARKFGSYTEHLAFPSIKKMLREKFNVDVTYQNVEAKKGADQMEIDVIGYVNKNINKVFVIEIKSKLNSSELKSTIKNLRRFPKFFPEHKDKALYGIVTALDYTPNIRQKALDAGIYFSVIQDDLFRMDIPDSFIPKRFDNR